MRAIRPALLAVEFYGETEAELTKKCQHLEKHLAETWRVKMTLPPLRVLDAKQQADVWSVRKAGLGLLTRIRGDYKPIPVIEDVSVPVEHLAEYVARSRKWSLDMALAPPITRMPPPVACISAR